MAVTIIKNKETNKIEKIVNSVINLSQEVGVDFTVESFETVDLCLLHLEENYPTWKNDFQIIFVKKQQ